MNLKKAIATRKRRKGMGKSKTEDKVWSRRSLLVRNLKRQMELFGIYNYLWVTALGYVKYLESKLYPKKKLPTFDDVRGILADKPKKARTRRGQK